MINEKIIICTVHQGMRRTGHVACIGEINKTYIFYKNLKETSFG
jgi:hypothetical protein